MIPILGGIALSLSLGISLIGLLVLYVYSKNQKINYFISGWRAAFSVSNLCILATVLMLNELLTSNFDVNYVALHTSFETPILYKITALWAGQSGSLLFWLFILSVYSIIILFKNKNHPNQLSPWIIMTILFVQLFFLIIVNFFENPFMPTKADFVILNGNGLNPLLQNLTMAIHPPILYLGYVGFTIPFAYGIAALISKYTGLMWISEIRRWAMIAWLFQSMGIILGGWWAYQELGWGGYWAWDPVENASFMPWLTGTAFLHSIMIQEKKGMLKVWNMILVLITFILCIFGTFLTRSGIMSSVHSFAVSDLGPAFLCFIVILLLICAYLVISRLDILKTKNKIESFTSRESGFLFNNLIFLVICFSVFWGTIFPVLSEAITGEKITVGPPFYNQVNIPIGLFLLLLTGVGPLLVWGKTSRIVLLKNFKVPLIISIFSLPLCFALNITGYALISFPLAIFSLTAITKEFYRGVFSRVRRFNESPFIGLVSLISKNRTRYGGHIVHLGIIFMFIGFTGHAFDKEAEFAIKKGDVYEFEGYEFELASIFPSERSNHFAWVANLNIRDNEKELVTTLSPEKRVYFHTDPNPDKRQPHSELDIYGTISRDIYSIFSGFDVEEQIAYFKIMINPLVWWVWFGAYVLVFGSMISLWPAKNHIK